EIKSSATGRRRHYFRLEQLQGPPGVVRCIGSLLVERVGRGATCLDLLSRIRGRLTDEPGLTLKVESVVAILLGSSVPEALSEEFSLEGARASLAFFSTDEVPGNDPTPAPEGREFPFFGEPRSCHSDDG